MAGRQSVLGALVQRAQISVTQGSADAFAVTTQETGISTAARYGWMIDSIEFFLSALDASANADSSVFIQVSQGPVPGAVVAEDDDDFVASWDFSISAHGTPANTILLPLQSKWMAPDNYVVVDPQMHLLIDSTATGLANTARAIINYYPIELPELDILRLIALR